ncbi:MAG TPA: MlaD family protein [Thermoleophilaceae bacterium]|nr:MlaD family protein [Thermoleophilaceae bacterium]
MRRVLAITAVAGACAAAVALTGASDEGSKGKSYWIEFDNSFGLVEGGDVKVGNVRAGQTTEFKVDAQEGERPKALVRVEITEPGFDSFRTDAECRIRPQSLIGEYYVDCEPGAATEELADGGRVPVGQTSSVVPEDLLRNVMRRPYRERFRLILAELGTGLAGRPEDLQEVLKRAHPGLRETSEVLEILGDQNRIIQNFITDSDQVIASLEERKADVARWVVEAGETAEITATRRTELARQFELFPTFLDELKPTMVELANLTDEQTPLLRDLQAAAPHLEETFTELGPFADSSLVSFRSLGETAKVGRAALDESEEEIDELRRLAADAPELAKPLRQFLESIDDRRRAHEYDVRAASSDPPAPDKTHCEDDSKCGFTGMESVFNFVYWQTLSVNPFDELGHLLRFTVTEEAPCSHPFTGGEDFEAERDLYMQCNSWLGPNQPGLTDPDPTEGGQAALNRARAADMGVGVDQSATDHGENQPEAPPIPGKKDWSQPEFALPPSLQSLLDALEPAAIPRQRLPEVGDVQERLPDVEGLAPEVRPETILDYLLAP